MTKKENFGKCTVSLALKASKGAEAYLAVHARRGSEGWEGITTRVVEAGGKVRAGRVATDFEDQETGLAADGLVADKPFQVVIDADEKGRVKILVGNKETAAIEGSKRPTGASGSSSIRGRSWSNGYS